MSAVVFGGTIFFAPASHASLVRAPQNTSSFINNLKAQTLPQVEPQSTVAAPPAAQKPPVTTTATSPVQVPAGDPVITVGPGDYLSKLAAANETTYQRLYYANSSIKDPDLIYPDEELTVPGSNEELTPRPLPADAPAEPTQPAVPAGAPGREPAAQTVPAPAEVTAGGSAWDRLAACESGGNWAINTGNGFYGGLQFTLSSWQGAGGSGLPSQASRDEQIARAQTLESRQGWGAWPVCSVKAGLR